MFAHSPQNDLTLPQSPMCAGIWLQAQPRSCHCVLTPSEQSGPVLGPLPGPAPWNRVCCGFPGRGRPPTAMPQSADTERRGALLLAGWRIPSVGRGCHFTPVSGN